MWEERGLWAVKQPSAQSCGRRDSRERIKAPFSHPSICISPLLQTTLCKMVRVRPQGNGSTVHLILGFFALGFNKLFQFPLCFLPPPVPVLLPYLCHRVVCPWVVLVGWRGLFKGQPWMSLTPEPLWDMEQCSRGFIMHQQYHRNGSVAHLVLCLL